MVRAGVVKAGLDYRKGYTLQFVDKKVGLDLRPKPIAQMPRAGRLLVHPLVALRGVGKTFPNGTLALAGLDLDVRAGRIPVAARPLGLRQIDGAAHHRRLERAERGQRRMAAAGAMPRTAKAGSASCSRSRR